MRASACADECVQCGALASGRSQRAARCTSSRSANDLLLNRWNDLSHVSPSTLRKLIAGPHTRRNRLSISVGRDHAWLDRVDADPTKSELGADRAEDSGETRISSQSSAP